MTEKEWREILEHTLANVHERIMYYGHLDVWMAGRKLTREEYEAKGLFDWMSKEQIAARLDELKTE